MSDFEPSVKRAKELLLWFQSDESRAYDSYRIFPYDPDRVKYELHDGPLVSQGSWSVEEFIGALLYHEALRLEEETGFSVDATILAHEVAIDFMSVKAAA